MKRAIRLWLVLALALIASPLSAQAQSGAGHLPALRISEQTEERGPVIRVQAMGNIPMAMVMPGNTLFEMSAGACAAGILVGALSVVVLPVYSGSMVLTNSAIGCGVGIAATVAATLGMSAARSIAN
jgi:hypothetical protein